MKKLICSVLFFSLSSLSFAASLSPMDKSAAMNELSNKTITTISAATLDGKMISDQFTGYFSNDGKVKGTFANKPNDGPQADQGSWMVKPNGNVCVTWDHWNQAQEKCVSFYKLNNALLIVNMKNGFESLVLNNDIKSGNKM